MPRRSEANAAAQPISEKSLTVEPHGAPAVIKRVGKALAILIGVVVVIGAITAFKMDVVTTGSQ
jgi:hypothetical protein